MEEADPWCPHYGFFTIKNYENVTAALIKLEYFAFDTYYMLLMFLAPFDLAANVLSAVLLLVLKELRNPFNVILCIMCLECTISLAIRTSLVYRKELVGGVCNADTMTYSLALHTLVEINSWAPLRATYTWLAVILTFARLYALRSKGKWEPSYPLVLSLCALAAAFSAVAGIPLFMVNTIDYYPQNVGCGDPELDPSRQVPRTTFSETLYDNNCLLYGINQWITGVFHNTLPALLLLVFTVQLTVEISRARKSHMAVAGRSAKKNDNAMRAARMLIILTVLTLLSEIPQGLASIVNGMFTPGFQYWYSERLTTLWMLIQVVATSCNLLITLAMSKSFRNSAFRIVCFWRMKSTSSPNVSVISVSTTADRRR